MRIVEVAQLVQQDISAHKTRNLMAIIIASLVVMIYSLLNQTLLSTLFMTAFNLSSAPQIILWGVSPVTILMIAFLLLTAPLCVFINRHTLKPHK